MRRVFFRVYAAVVGTVFIVMAGMVATFWWTTGASVGTHAQETLERTILQLAQEIGETTPGSPERSARLHEARQRTLLWLALIPAKALQADGVDVAALRDGEPLFRSPLDRWPGDMNGWVLLPGEDLVLEAQIPGLAEVAAALDATTRPDDAGEPLPPGFALNEADAARLLTGPVFRVRDDGTTMTFRASNGALRRAPLPSVRPPLPPWVTPLLMLVLVGLAIGFVIRPVQRELERLAEATRRLSDGDLTARVQLPAKSPLAKLGVKFDTMAERVQAVLENNEDLLRAVSHELRTPISRLMFSIDLIRETDSEEKRAAYLETAERTVEEMGELARELLELARLGEVSPALEREPRDLMQLAARAFSTEMEVTAEEAEDRIGGEPVIVDADPRLAVRAIANIVRNARRYGDGQVTVQVEKREDVACLHVDDDGPGIPPEDRERVAKPFQRLESSRNRELGGAGLGLAIATRIAERHGGALLIGESPTLRGARITFEIPLA